MEQIKKNIIVSLKSKVLLGKFGKGKYFGYKNKKIISLVEIKTKDNAVAYGESLVGIYSTNLFKKNLDYLSKFFLNKNVYEALEISKQLQNNKFFFYSGLIQSVLASIEIACLNLLAKLKNKNLSEIIKEYFNCEGSDINEVPIYASAGSIKSTLKDLKQDLKLAENLNIKIIKIRHNINNSFHKKYIILKKNNFKFSIDFISNSFLKNKNLEKSKIMDSMVQSNPLWIEECVNVNEIHTFIKLKKKYKKLRFSYGENFNSKFDFINLIKFYKFDYINLDISHICISEFIKIIKFLKKNNIRKKIIFHCWGGVINLHTSLELASIFKDQIYMTELPIADFSLNNKYIFKLGIKDSKVNINSVDRKNINSYYQKIVIF